MKRTTKNNKTGFTLVEVMLAIAIMLLISGLFVSLIIATHESYYTTYNYNDSTDYCQLYGKMISDQILHDRQDFGMSSGSSRKYWMNPSICQFCTVGSSTPVVEMPRVVNRDGSLKWIFAVSNVDFDPTTNMCDIEITVIDNYHNPGDILYVYHEGFWIPNLSDADGNHVGSTITVSEGTNHPISTGAPGSGSSVNNYEIIVEKN